MIDDTGRFITPILFVILLSLMALGWCSVYQRNAECERRGGILIKGAWTYQCVSMEKR